MAIFEVKTYEAECDHCQSIEKFSMTFYGDWQTPDMLIPEGWKWFEYTGMFLRSDKILICPDCAANKMSEIKRKYERE